MFDSIFDVWDMPEKYDSQSQKLQWIDRKTGQLLLQFDNKNFCLNVEWFSLKYIFDVMYYFLNIYMCQYE